MDASGAVPASQVVGMPATELAARVRSGALSAVDVVRAHLDHIADVDARIGAFRVVRTAAALDEAAAVDAVPQRSALPLAGVPVAVKDNVAVAGEVCTDGSLGSQAEPAAADHPVVARLRAAGAVVVGITRVPELCLYAATDGPHAVTRNPWDTALTPGGSSGGSAAAVAAGCVPIAHGNDGMGSLRIPAAACGLVTLKPGRGVVPGELGFDDWSGMAVNGALTTTVADLALATSVLAGADLGAGDPGRPLRIAVSTRSPVPLAGPDVETREAVDATVALLREAGHVVVPRDPVIPPGAAAGALARWMAGAHDDAEAYGLDRSRLQRRSTAHAGIGRAVRRAGLVRPAPAQRVRARAPAGRGGGGGGAGLAPPATAERFRARTTAFFDDVDLLLTPVTNGPPLAARPWHERSFVGNLTANTRWAPWASPWNLAGVPALVLPVGRRPEGLPLALQLVGPPGAEGRLLWLAAELERRHPWRRHAPVFDPAAPATVSTA